MHASFTDPRRADADRQAGRLFRRLLIATALAGAGSAFAATCTQTTDLGTLAPAATATFGNAFGAEADFSDCWDFRIAAMSNVSGSTTESIADFWFLPRHIDVQTISLWDRLLGTQIGASDTTPDGFSFTSLAAGSYELVVSGYATQGFETASYAGTLVASPVGTVPEPSMAALLVLALGAAGLARRKAPSARG